MVFFQHSKLHRKWTVRDYVQGEIDLCLLKALVDEMTSGVITRIWIQFLGFIF